MRASLFAVVVLGGCLADAAPGTEEGPDLVVGVFEEVDGTGHFRAALGPAYTGRGDYVSAIGSSGVRVTGPVNFLFYDVEAREGRWLLPAGDRSVLRTETVADSGRVRAFAYEVVEADTDGDDRLGSEDVRTIALSDPAGRRMVRLVEGADRLRQIHRLDDDTVLVLYDAAGTVGAIEVNLDALEIEAEVVLPPLPRAADPEAGA